MITDQTYADLIKLNRKKNLLEVLPDQLLDLWCGDYVRTHPRADLTVVNLPSGGSAFTYLFDIKTSRNLVAFGIPIYISHKRDASRMQGHPLSPDLEGYHRGHLMAHSIGGGADINLVPQLGKLNIGEFRRLEREVRDVAKNNEKSLYFVRCVYPRGLSQTPETIEQCVIYPSGVMNYRIHANS
jgi:hypothetical protein